MKMDFREMEYEFGTGLNGIKIGINCLLFSISNEPE
jgi:hypothetical protein